MIELDRFADLLDGDRKDVLLVSVDLDPTLPENQTVHPAWRIRLRNGLDGVLARLNGNARAAAEEVAGRILAYVDTRPRARGLVVLAGGDLWRDYALPVPVPERVSYGRPDLMPLIWALEQYAPYGIVSVDRESARVWIAYLGRTAMLDEQTHSFNVGEWREMVGRPPTQTRAVGTGAGRSTQRDRFAARVADHERRFWREVAGATAQWLDRLRLSQLIIGGPDEAARAVEELLPPQARAKVAAVVPVPAHAEPADIQARTLPVALAHRMRHDDDLVTSLLDRVASRTGGVIGRAPTLDALARRKAMTLVADRDVTGEARLCGACGQVDAAAVALCPSCDAPVEVATLPQVLPLLAHRSGASIELVGGDAAARLREHEGVGAILRYAG